MFVGEHTTRCSEQCRVATLPTSHSNSTPFTVTHTKGSRKVCILHWFRLPIAGKEGWTGRYRRYLRRSPSHSPHRQQSPMLPLPTTRQSALLVQPSAKAWPSLVAHRRVVSFVDTRIHLYVLRQICRQLRLAKRGQIVTYVCHFRE